MYVLTSIQKITKKEKVLMRVRVQHKYSRIHLQYNSFELFSVLIVKSINCNIHVCMCRFYHYFGLHDEDYLFMQTKKEIKTILYRTISSAIEIQKKLYNVVCLLVCIYIHTYTYVSIRTRATCFFEKFQITENYKYKNLKNLCHTCQNNLFGF